MSKIIRIKENCFNSFKFLCAVLMFETCSYPDQVNVSDKKILAYYHDWQKALEESIINDFFSPPVASRVYMYANLSVAVVLPDTTGVFVKKPGGNHLTIPLPTTLNKSLVALFSFYHTGMYFVFDQTRLQHCFKNFQSSLRKVGFSKAQLDTFNLWGKRCAEKIIIFSKSDGYAQARSDDKYQFLDHPGNWQPTPPDYLDGLEPHWGEMKTFFLDSASQFRPVPPTPFSANPKSKFFSYVNEVYQLSKTDTSILKHDIAYYWDCNPLALQHEGHLTYTNKKLTPGGHWLHICLQASRLRKLNFEQTVFITSLLSTVIYDSFISCWETKYYYNYTRPVTAIKKLIDDKWQPLLITPNFPEYTSGHSVISTASSLVLNQYFGSFSFTDSSEIRFGYKVRTFNSFLEASDEACISRLYGGIHFREAIEKGKSQGQAIAEFIIHEINLMPYERSN